jgi:hypothetical protein
MASTATPAIIGEAAIKSIAPSNGEYTKESEQLPACASSHY